MMNKRAQMKCMPNFNPFGQVASDIKKECTRAQAPHSCLVGKW